MNPNSQDNQGITPPEKRNIGITPSLNSQDEQLKTILEELIGEHEYYSENDKTSRMTANRNVLKEEQRAKIPKTLAKIEGMIREERADAIKSYKKILRIQKKAKANLGVKEDKKV